MGYTRTAKNDTREIGAMRKSPRLEQSASKLGAARGHQPNAVQEKFRLDITKEPPRLSRAKKTVSVAGLYTAPRKSKRPHAPKKHRKKQDKVVSGSDLVLEFNEGIEGARAELRESSTATFNNVHSELTDRLKKLRSRDNEFFEHIKLHANVLSQSLATEEIEISTIRDGKRFPERLNLGKRISHLKKTVEKEKAKLDEYWKEWNDMQDEYIELGIEAFGAGAFRGNVNTDRPRKKGFQKEMAVLDLERSHRFDDFNHEIDEMVAADTQKMKSSEKGLDALVKKEQSRLLHALIQV